MRRKKDADRSILSALKKLFKQLKATNDNKELEIELDKQNSHTAIEIELLMQQLAKKATPKQVQK